MAESRAAGTIYDLGYQGYDGQRLGRLNAFWRVVQFSYGAAYGMKRGPRARMVPMIVTVIALLPAIGQIAVASLTGQMQMINYGLYLNATAFFIGLFAAAQSPELVVQDRQYGVLSLYLSRPLRATDYALAKLVAMMLAMLTITLTPQLILLVGKIALAETPSVAIRTEGTEIFPILGGALGTSFFMASIGLGISAWCSRRAFANAGVIGYFFILPAAASIFRSITTGDTQRYAVLAHPIWMLLGFSNWLFDVRLNKRSTVARVDLPGIAYLYALLGISLVFVALLLWRYRRSEQ